MRIVIHDFSGHPFQAQLARELASRGASVTHVSSSSYATGKGRVQLEPGDPDSLRFVDVKVPGGWAKYTYWRRVHAERQYAKAFLQKLTSLSPQIVVSSNVPLLAHDVISRRLARWGIPEIFWHQDVYSAAMTDMLERAAGSLGSVLGRIPTGLERRIAKRSSAVVAISEPFLDLYKDWGIPRSKTMLQPNWAPIDEIPVLPKANAWARAQGLDQVSPVFLYAGTLGLKHNPRRLLTVADELKELGGVLAVASEGDGIDFLQSMKPRLGDALLLLPFQPYEDLPRMLAAADVLVTLLEPEAARYSVPSKILTNHCAGRAQLASIPAENAAGMMVRQAGSGVVIDPDDEAGWRGAVHLLCDEPQRRDEMGRAARAYAEAKFRVQAVGDRFVRLMEDVTSRKAVSAYGKKT